MSSVEKLKIAIDLANFIEDHAIYRNKVENKTKGLDGDDFFVFHLGNLITLLEEISDENEG